MFLTNHNAACWNITHKTFNIADRSALFQLMLHFIIKEICKCEYELKLLMYLSKLCLNYILP